MCGIFGLFLKDCNFISLNDSLKLSENLAVLSESRGKESAGLEIVDYKKNCIKILKGPCSASELIESEKYKTFKSNVAFYQGKFSLMGHSRLVTNGSYLNQENNQPVVKENISAIHNGIIVNHSELWSKIPASKKIYDIDTEIVLSLLRYNIEMNHYDSGNPLELTFSQLKGTISTCLIFNDKEEIILYSNNGSLYFLTDDKSFLIFASEKYTLIQLINSNKCLRQFTADSIKQLSNETAVILYGADFLQYLNINKFQGSPFNPRKNIFEIITDTVKSTKKLVETLIDSEEVLRVNSTKYLKFLEHNFEEISKLRRCAKCLLPETFPFIMYDEKGECNYCKNYIPRNKPQPIETLLKIVEPYRRNGKPDCLLPFSGGRDSTYVVHFAKKELGLNPVTFTYDWGMVTDLARRNIARICGKLRIENIIVSANIMQKREFIRKNISAWLKHPNLGMIPLFMAGDKYFFYYANKIRKQTGLKLQIWGINRLENTDFKVGFAGLSPNFNKKTIYSLRLLEQAKLFGFVGKNILNSPSYLNTSVWDTLGSFFSRYMNSQEDYYHLFDYIYWDEKVIEDTILNEYEWEIAHDTKSTWRIGDGTASFYNYIYYTVAGFSEFDTFRSNQIREGMITREQGMKFIEDENKPRYESLMWYLSVVGLDFEDTIKKINAIPKLYRP